jgi:acetyl esterase/lipase
VMSLSTATTATAVEEQELISSPPAYYLRLAYFISVWSFKAVIAVGLRLRRTFTPRLQHLLQPEVKAYSCRPFLKNRIFRPQGFVKERLPLYLDLHGGGWAVADPETDDEFCSFLASTFNFIVVSVNYRKSPSYKFPCAVDDVVAIADAVLADESLKIDETKVAMGGFSSGGNLAFAACQNKLVKDRIHALVGFYPGLDLAESVEDKLKHRPKEAGKDILRSSVNFLAWAYVPYGTNRKDPLLSPIYARRENFPAEVCLVGAEYDMLCHEANRMAEALVDNQWERESDETRWRQGGIRWECAEARYHAFTHVKLRGKKEINRAKFVSELYNRVGVWLQQEAWK